jgi:hypothetical protein
MKPSYIFLKKTLIIILIKIILKSKIEWYFYSNSNKLVIDVIIF